MWHTLQYTYVCDTVCTFLLIFIELGRAGPNWALACQLELLSVLLDWYFIDILRLYDSILFVFEQMQIFGFRLPEKEYSLHSAKLFPIKSNAL